MKSSTSSGSHGKGLGHPVVPVVRREVIVVDVGLKARHAEIWHLKWRRLMIRSKRRGLPCTLTFRQFLRLATRAGLTRPSQIGTASSQYNLSRYGDTGGYTPGNCRFITSAQNREERVTNGGIERGAAKRRGLTASNCAWRARIAEKISKPFALVSPSGKVYRGVNLTAFCKAHGLNQGNVGCVARGTKSQTQGWTKLHE
jgi:hypothetical protein